MVLYMRRWSYKWEIKIGSLRWEKVPVEGYCRIQGGGEGGDLSICQKMILCPALMKKCHNILMLDFTFNNILRGVLVCAPILKIKKKIISDSLSPWNYFYKTMVLILSQFLKIKTMVLVFWWIYKSRISGTVIIQWMTAHTTGGTFWQVMVT